MKRQPKPILEVVHVFLCATCPACGKAGEAAFDASEREACDKCGGPNGGLMIPLRCKCGASFRAADAQDGPSASRWVSFAMPGHFRPMGRRVRGGSASVSEWALAT